MEISFREKKLHKICTDVRELRRAYNIHAEKISQRLQELCAAESLMDMAKLPAARLHLLKGEYNGYFAVDIKQPFRIIFKALDGNSSDYKTITKVELIAIKDYH